MELMKYKYYDTPDGQDCFPKMFYISKYAASVGKYEQVRILYIAILFFSLQDVYIVQRILQ